MNTELQKEAKQGEIKTKGLTLRQEKAVEMVANGCISKAEALRSAGYSEAVIRHPGRVFNSPAVQAAIEERAREAGLKEADGFKALKELSNARLIRKEYFPSVEESGISDDKIIKTFSSNGFKVMFITETKSTGGRTVMYTIRDWRTLKEFVKLTFKVFGTYAPRRTENDHRVTSFSLASLRQWKRENNKPIV